MQSFSIADGVIYLFIFAMWHLMIGEPKNLPPTRMFKMLELFKQQFEKTSLSALKHEYSQPDLSACLALLVLSVSLAVSTTAAKFYGTSEPSLLAATSAIAEFYLLRKCLSSTFPPPFFYQKFEKI